MTEEQMDAAHELCEKLWEKVHDVVDADLEGVDEEIAEEVRDRMTQTFRFWKRYE